MANEIIRERNAAAGAWAAAATVLSIGALLFGFTAHVRANELEAALDQLRAETVRPTANGMLDTGSAPPSSATPGATEGQDEGVARIAITRAFNTVYDSSLPMEERMAKVDNPDGIGDALLAAQDGENGPLIRSVVVSVNDVRFNTPGAAAVTYTLTVPNMAPFSGRSGAANVVDGEWKVARATICGDLVDIGSGC